ncbi:hypothetical protein GLYMA_08G248000v4 [Glycine max]|uniref:isoflavone 7-O-methyltransferase n=3 Tax=Glycine subgen. Soja TaxID=1462606 RepID=I1KWG9_SOYBN|nr:isoflavone 7-O-methyltransferase [Glycine max]XP_028245033.1 isoflavone 7-O-methyltransferase-like [Glycine soja]KRH45066.1 hypothetical protein GLYMA_08G248000v4 [Glycine max]RZB98676.1 Isoflavone 7-O-methyltransferase [Glycine soja]|eukprot:XP_003531866.1 isoflavone 7-O-methyltransferase [Glycine max]
MASSNGRKASEIFQGQALIYRHMFAFIDSMCLKTIIELGIPDIIHKHGQPITLSELVSILHVPPARVGHVQSLMHYLSHHRFFESVRIHEKEAYALTAASELLVKSSELSLAPMVEYILDPTLSASFHQMKKWVYEEDLSVFDISLGCSLWDFLNKNPAYNESFNEAMARDSQMSNLALRDCKLVFEGLESIVDVGGGTGATARMISEAFPDLKCVVLDRPHVLENLSESNNLTYVGGDMFKSIPKADAVLLKWILHDWTDKDCIKILENCKEAISSNNGKRGKIIVIDMVIQEKQDEHKVTELKLLWDVAMACVLNGKERNEEEWKKLFMEAGFQDYKISPLTGFLSLIEIYP